MWTPPPPPTPNQPKQFRRKQRVVRIGPNYNGTPNPRNGMRGTVINPENYVDASGKRYITVRWDSQQPYERGCYEDENSVETDTSGGNDFDQRHYNIHYLSGTEVAQLRGAVERDRSLSDDERKKLLGHLPVLP